ncbi:cytidyltransferase [Vibrio alginolyticus]|uniref:cytidylyltransferase domain-containing protein n=1 Tax=Vibrio TaxID=662 RepID=UPI001BD2A3D4|nr:MULTISPECIES: cytidyltransferase [Vibrio]MBS9942074.1 cytidyltransferase [Vibrio alginolyticus]MDW2058728.1 cytidyltransferase [Vibrio sp. Vb1076]
MKVIAVIPARAGSKGIPNKNIRLVNEKPLVYYSINNALKCDEIDEVVVSTDSKEVQIIAEQMGAKTHWRDESLCGDEVTLDGVIYDVAKRYSESPNDIIVTMQPTSPTLKMETLKKAVRYYQENDFDTLISCVNRPHLAWREDKLGKKYPDYEERLNRQYLPPFYLETGAFLIARKNIMTPKTRLGENIEVFEVSEDEAIDIDSYSDLKSAEHVLSNNRVAFYVNGNTKRGLGHVYRCLELADEFSTSPDIYYDINQTTREIFGDSNHNFIGVNGIGELFEALTKNKYDLFVNDILNTTIDYMIALKACNPAKKVINFEDDGEGTLKADLVINALYQNPTIPQMKAGEDFYICGKTFLFYEPVKVNEKVKNVFISFGGADPQNYTDRLLNLISKPEYEAYNFTVVIGRAKQNVDTLLEFNKYKNIEVLYDVRNMPQLMSSCDIAITSRGRTGYELALLGLPTMAMAQNAREEKHGFVSQENGFNYLGLNPTDSIIKANLDLYLSLDYSDRAKIQEKLLEHDLRNGRKRVLGLINSL